jgi:hypothetical protein
MPDRPADPRRSADASALPADFVHLVLAALVDGHACEVDDPLDADRASAAGPGPGAHPGAPPAGASPVDLALCARLARAALALPDPAATLRPGAVVPVEAPEDDPLHGDAVARAIAHALRVALEAAGLRDEGCPLEILRATTGDERTAGAVRRMLERRGTVLVPAAPGRPVPPAMAAIVEEEPLTLPPLAPEDVAHMLAATERAGTRSLAQLLALLPPPERLARIGSLHLVHAWAAPRVEDLAARLHATADRLARVARERAEAEAASAPAPPAPRLAELHGLGQARAVLERIVAEVEDWRRGALDWDDVGASILLHGPPGVGKTSVAQALAAEIGGPVIDIGYTTVQAAGHLGQMLADLDRRLDDARANTPCVVLVDEADDLAARDARPGRHGARYMHAVVNAYLVRLSALVATPGVIVVLATNHPGRLDPALVRAGRVDHHLGLRLPGRDALGRTLAGHLGDRAAPGLRETSDWQAATQALVGATGADAARLAREAIATARQRQRGTGGRSERGAPRPLRVGPADLRAALAGTDRLRPVPPEELRRVAVHEAGHLVAGHVLGRPAARRAWIGPRGGGVEAPAVLSHTRITAEADLAALLAGRAAETRLLGAPSSGAGAGPDSDLAHATGLAWRIVHEWQLLDPAAVRPWSGAEIGFSFGRRMEQDALVTGLLDHAQERAARLVDRNAEVVERIAAALVEARELNGPRIAELLGDRGEAGPPAPDAPSVAAGPADPPDPVPP